MSDFREDTHSFLNTLLRIPEDSITAFAREGIAPDAVWDIAHPVNRLQGVDAIVEGFILPLRSALSHVHRRDEIFFGGPNRRSEGGNWCASVTHYVGNHTAPLYGIAPNDRLAFLRSGEFYRVDDGFITQARLIPDFIDLMRQSGSCPLPDVLGTQMLFPGPATHDGVLPDGNNGEESLDVVEAMLADLHKFDPLTFGSKSQTGNDGHWHEDMLWYGPGGIGSNYRWDGFVKDHREAFLMAFPDRKGGNHYCRIGNGDYAAVSGWPSMTMTHAGDYLGVAATGKPLTLRVMDFYRCADGRIMENWVLLDYWDLFNQMGVEWAANSGNRD